MNPNVYQADSRKKNHQAKVPGKTAGTNVINTSPSLITSRIGARLRLIEAGKSSAYVKLAEKALCR
jgi:hypothetical protein